MEHLMSDKVYRIDTNRWIVTAFLDKIGFKRGDYASGTLTPEQLQARQVDPIAFEKLLSISGDPLVLEEGDIYYGEPQNRFLSSLPLKDWRRMISLLEWDRKQLRSLFKVGKGPDGVQAEKLLGRYTRTYEEDVESGVAVEGEFSYVEYKRHGFKYPIGVHFDYRTISRHWQKKSESVVWVNGATGVLVADNYVITAAHVVLDRHDDPVFYRMGINYVGKDPRAKPLYPRTWGRALLAMVPTAFSPYHVIAVDKEADLAILAVPYFADPDDREKLEEIRRLKLAEDLPQPGAPTMTIGQPKTRDWTSGPSYTWGIFLGAASYCREGGEKEEEPLWEFLNRTAGREREAPSVSELCLRQDSFGGYSGSPVINEQGQAFGIETGRYPNSYATKAASLHPDAIHDPDLRQVLEEIRAVQKGQNWPQKERDRVAKLIEPHFLQYVADHPFGRVSDKSHHSDNEYDYLIIPNASIVAFQASMERELPNETSLRIHQAILKLASDHQILIGAT